MERSWDVLITTYEICNLEKTALTRFAWSYLIIDEVRCSAVCLMVDVVCVCVCLPVSLSPVPSKA